MKQDLGFYDYWPYENRPKIQWPGGAKLAFWGYMQVHSSLIPVSRDYYCYQRG